MPMDRALPAPVAERVQSLVAQGCGKTEAAAIAYSGFNEDLAPTSSGSARVADINGWYEIKGNPISKVGVFPYLGSSLGPEYIQDKVYQVYRPAEELGSPECIESFKLIPWRIDHVMLGARYTPVDEAGFDGVIGEDVYFDGTTLRGNIKWFTDRMHAGIENGDHRELSAGYFCRYENSSGNYNGQRYDVVMRDIRGNHLASVYQGRMGPDVAVLDQLKITFDAKEITMTTKQAAAAAAKTGTAKDDADTDGATNQGMTLEQAAAHLEAIVPAMAAMQETVNKLNAATETDPDAIVVDGDDKDGDDKDGKKEKKAEDKRAMDAAVAAAVKPAMDGLTKQLKALQDSMAELQKNGEKTLLGRIAEKNALVDRLLPFTGTFDHAHMTRDEVAAYGVKHLGLKAAAGTEIAALDGYLHNRPAPNSGEVYGLNMDSADTSRGAGLVTSLDSYLAGRGGNA